MFLKKHITILFALLCLSSFGQQYSFLQYSLKEGLAQTQVRCIHQDKQGYVWIGTLGGASKFNGSTFVNFNRTDGLINNQINCIQQLQNEQIVFGSIGGISVLDGNTFNSYKFSGDFNEASTTSLYEINSNNLLIGTEHGLLLFSGNNFIENNTTLFFKGESIKRIRKSRNDEVLVATKKGIWRLTNNQWIQEYLLADKENVIFDFIESSTNELWVVSSLGGVTNAQSGGTIPNLGDFALANVFTGIDSQNGEIYFTSRTGVVQYNEKTQTHLFFSKSNGLSIDDIRQVFTDREGIRWFASYGGGIFKLTSTQFKSFTTNNGLTGNAVMSITQDSRGNYFFGTYDNGISILSNPTDNFNANFNAALHELSPNLRVWTTLKSWGWKGAIWIGTPEGLYAYDCCSYAMPHWLHFGKEEGLEEELVLSLLERRDGSLLIGTNKGIQAYSNKTFQSFSQLPNFPATRIRHMLEAKDGKIWMATRDGISLFQNNSFTNFGEAQGLQDASAYSIAELPNGEIIAGTQSGLYKGNENGFARLNISEEPGGNTVNFLKVIQNKLWIGTLNGIFIWQLNQNGALGERTIHLNESDGLISLETNLNAIYVDLQNTVWVGTPEGVMQIELNAIDAKFNIPTPIVHLANIQSNLENIDWKALSSGAWNGKSFPNGLEFDYRQNSFTFFFDASSTTYPERLEFSYWLEGLDSSWSSPTAFSQVNINNLPSGKYTFHIRARNGKWGMWSEEVTWQFTILPPWYLRWWIILLEIVLVTGLVVFISYSRRKNTRNKHLAEQSEMKSKLLILEQQSMNSSMNRHFIFNALNSIQYYINRQDRLAANQYLTDFAKLIRKNLDSSEENFAPLSEEIERLELYLKLESMRFPDKFKYHIQLDSPEIIRQVKIPAMLIQPFLENSIWHGLLPKESGGKLNVFFGLNEGCLEIRIEDNGIGIAESQARKTTSDGHISKGMEITRNRIALIEQMTGKRIELKGPEDWKSEIGESGTRVSIHFPKDFQEIFNQGNTF
jgi:ligand-binding sensor domain-containing protein